MPIPVLMHGTFRTNVDRQCLTPDDCYNQALFQEAADLFVESVLPLLINYSTVDSGQVLDFLSLRRDIQSDDQLNVFWKKLRELLLARRFIPSYNGSQRLRPSEVQLSPVNVVDLEEFKSLLGERAESERRFCHSSAERNSTRRRVLEELGAVSIDPMDVPRHLSAVPLDIRVRVSLMDRLIP